MEYVPGSDLGDLAKTSTTNPRGGRSYLAICAGVHACHDSLDHPSRSKAEQRPGHQRSEWEDRVKILDFGSPSLSTLRFSRPTRHALPRMAQFMAPQGTLPRASPSNEPTEKVDQYGITSLLYLLLAGKDPYPDLEGDDLLHAILRGRYTPLATLRPDLAPVLLAAVARGLQVDPDHRFPNVSALAEAILSESSPKLLKGWTHYFRPPKPLNRRLIGAVSAPHRNGMVEQVSPRVFAPMPEPAPPRAPPVPPSVPALFAVPAAAAHPPTPRSPPSPPEYKVPSSRHPHRQRTKEMSTLITFVCGAAFGAIVATLALLVFLIAESHAAFCPAPPAAPPPSQLNPPSAPSSPTRS